MKILLKSLCVCLLLYGLIFSVNSESYSETVKEQVEQEMPVLKGDTWIKMNDDEKISFIWGAGHIITIQAVLARDNPELKKSNTFVNKIMEARNNSPMTMNEIAQHVDDYYQKNPDKLDRAVMEIIWHEIVVPRLSGNDEEVKSSQ